MLEPKYIVKFGEKVPEEALAKKGDLALNVSEFFFDTIQGEGFSLGAPAAFLRLAGCPVNCEFCDTAVVWKTSQKVKIEWLIDQIKESGLAKKLNCRQMILVVTGGSPLLQQDSLLEFFQAYEAVFEKIPIIEVENECSFIPKKELLPYIWWWNNSPKLSNAGVSREKRYKPEVLEFMGSYLGNCTWKFVVKDEQDWKEVEEDFIVPYHIHLSDICLMPMGATQEDYFANREKVVELAVKYGVKYSPREHIAIWNKKTGI